jgi:hypothetical protein
MSNLAYARPAPLQTPAPRTRHVEIVATREQRRARPKLAYAVVTVGSLFVIFAAQLLLSIVVSEGAYEISSLQQQQKELLRTQDFLSERLQVLDSTQNLTTQAAGFGMVPNSGPLALDLSSGSVYPLPGSTDRFGCGGSCNLVTNSLLTGMPLVDPNAPAAGHADPAAGTAPTATQTGQTPTATDALPAPVTR